MKKTILTFFMLVVLVAFLLLKAGSSESPQNDIYVNPPDLNQVSPQTTSRESWTLFTYGGEIPEKEEQTNRIEGYGNQTECIEKGISLTSAAGSFECGYGCEYKAQYNEEICNKVCGKNGCRE